MSLHRFHIETMSYREISDGISHFDCVILDQSFSGGHVYPASFHSPSNAWCTQETKHSINPCMVSQSASSLWCPTPYSSKPQSLYQVSPQTSVIQTAGSPSKSYHNGLPESDARSPENISKHIKMEGGPGPVEGEDSVKEDGSSQKMETQQEDAQSNELAPMNSDGGHEAQDSVSTEGSNILTASLHATVTDGNIVGRRYFSVTWRLFSLFAFCHKVVILQRCQGIMREPGGSVRPLLSYCYYCSTNILWKQLYLESNYSFNF